MLFNVDFVVLSSLKQKLVMPSKRFSFGLINNFIMYFYKVRMIIDSDLMQVNFLDILCSVK